MSWEQENGHAYKHAKRDAHEINSFSERATPAASAKAARARACVQGSSLVLRVASHTPGTVQLFDRVSEAGGRAISAAAVARRPSALPRPPRSAHLPYRSLRLHRRGDVSRKSAGNLLGGDSPSLPPVVLRAAACFALEHINRYVLVRLGVGLFTTRYAVVSTKRHADPVLSRWAGLGLMLM